MEEGRRRQELRNDVIEQDVVEVREPEKGLRLGAAVLGPPGRGVGHVVDVDPAREVRASGYGLSGELEVHHFEVSN